MKKKNANELTVKVTKKKKVRTNVKAGAMNAPAGVIVK